MTHVSDTCQWWHDIGGWGKRACYLTLESDVTRSLKISNLFFVYLLVQSILLLLLVLISLFDLRQTMAVSSSDLAKSAGRKWVWVVTWNTAQMLLNLESSLNFRTEANTLVLSTLVLSTLVLHFTFHNREWVGETKKQVLNSCKSGDKLVWHT